MKAVQQLNLHYSSAFVVKLGEKSTWNHIIGVLKDWLRDMPELRSSASFDLLLGSREFYTGCNWTNPSDRRMKISTDMFVRDGDSTLSPSYWGFRYEHPERDRRESRHQARLWRVDVTTRRIDDSQYRLVVRVFYLTDPFYSASYDERPGMSVPRFVKMLFERRHWSLVSGSLEISTNVLDVTSATWQYWVGKLFDENRKLPIVVYSGDDNEEVILDKISRLVMGSAIVLRLRNKVVTHEFNYGVEVKIFDQLRDKTFNTLACHEGMLRIYQWVNPRNQSNPNPHPFFSVEKIKSLGFQELNRRVQTCVMLSSPLYEYEDLFSIEDVHSIRQAARYNQLRSSSIYSNEIQEELFKDNELLQGQIRSLKEQLRAVEEDLETRMYEREVAIEEKNDLERKYDYERESMDRTLADFKSEREILTQKCSVIENMKTLPSSAEEVLTLISSVFPDRIVVTDRAQKSAQLYGSKNTELVWECLWSICTELYDIVFIEEASNIEGEYNRRSRFEYAKSEGKQTKHNSALVDIRKVEYDGEIIESWTHVKAGNKNDLLRVHFLYDEKKKKLVIWHCGDHMDNSLTKSKR